MEVLQFLLILCSVASIASSETDTLRKGYVLNSSESTFLVSANKNFSLGFFTPDGTNRTYLAIWFTGALSGQPVWISNRETPLPTSSSPKLFIDVSGRLILTHNGSSRAYPLSSTKSSLDVAATLQNSGNFVLREMNPDGSSGKELWSSFDNPTDTILPGMKLGVNHKTGTNWTLIPWLRDDNPEPGPYSLEWEPTKSHLVVKYRGVVHWVGVEMKNETHFVREMPSVQTDIQTFEYVIISTKEQEYFSFEAKLNPSLVPSSSLEEQAKYSFVAWRFDTQGFVSNVMNNMIVIDLRDCYGYEDETQQSKGCQLWELPECRGSGGQTFELRSGRFLNSTIDLGPLQVQPITTRNSSAGPTDCKENCWNDCDCVGYRSYTEGNDGICAYWKGKHLQFEEDNNGSTTREYVLKLLEGNERNNNSKKWIWILIPTVVVATLATMLVLLILHWRRRKREQAREVQELKDLFTLEGYTDIHELENGESGNLKVLSYEWIVTTTNNFSSYQKLGQGGFGSVYKGVTPEGQEVAIKQLSERSKQGIAEFKNEVVLIAKLQHTNLVKLLGYCIHRDQKMLIYEFMPNKSLDFFLFDPNRKEQLTWERRINIIEGIAQGLLYLHKYSRVKIIHTDMKASNILLDENMNPKISDFGMAKILRQNVTQAKAKKFGGTRGYMAPEYAIEGIFSMKSDVYSFGVLVLEIVTGKKNNCFCCEDGPLNLIEHAWELWNRDSVLQLIDPALRNMCGKEELLHRCINVGFLCVEDLAVDRPSMSDVISMLTNKNLALPKPKKPAFVSRYSVPYGYQDKKSEKFTVNELSISAMEAR